MQQDIQAVAAAIRPDSRVVVLTGAGMSAESGVPTFRDASTGLWAKYDPMTLATPEAFQRDPQLVWNFYLHRVRMLHKVAPNPGHIAVAALQSLATVAVITQNVDGLHTRAGSQDVLELHGSLVGLKRWNDGVVIDYELPTQSDYEFTKETLPRCPETGQLLRPNIVWFGEALDSSILDRAFDLCRNADVAIVIGTTGQVYPAAQLPLEAHSRGALLVDVNINESAFSHRADFWLQAPSGEVLPQILENVGHE